MLRWKFCLCVTQSAVSLGFPKKSKLSNVIFFSEPLNWIWRLIYHQEVLTAHHSLNLCSKTKNNQSTDPGGWREVGDENTGAEYRFSSPLPLLLSSSWSVASPGHLRRFKPSPGHAKAFLLDTAASWKLTLEAACPQRGLCEMSSP